jgi:uncharacterized protein YrrD
VRESRRRLYDTRVVSGGKDKRVNIDLGADIVGSDGEKLGVVDSLVVDPHDGQIRSIIVRKGLFFPTDRIIPADTVTGVRDGKVHVSITKDDVEQLTEYMDAEYILPPNGYYGGYGYSYMWPETSVYTSDLVVDEQVHERHPGAIILSEGTLVVDKDNDEVGRIVEIARDERGRVAGFKVEEGFFRHHDYYIPAHVVSRADDALVVLSVDKSTLEEVTGPKASRKRD